MNQDRCRGRTKEGGSSARAHSSTRTDTVQRTDPMVHSGCGPEVRRVVMALRRTLLAIRLYVLASVPGGPSGPFYDVFRKGSGLWKTFHTRASESSLVSRTWIREREQEWGEQSPLYLARVEGEFPDEAEGTLFRLADLEAAVGREIEQDENVRITFGVDIARFGDDRSAIATWRGHELLEVSTRRSLDTMEVASWVGSEINRKNPDRVRIDEIGIGSGVVDRLKQMNHYVDAVNVSRKADKPELFQNERAAMFWRLREALEKGEISLPDEEALLAELSALRYSYDPKGRIVIEKKELAKKRIGRSPDLADAVALGYLPSGRAGGCFAYLGGQIWDVRTCRPVERV